MEKMFVLVAQKAKFTEQLQTKYTNSIVFIQDTQEIWTHGTFYAIPDTYKTKITNLESAVDALKAVYGFTSISDGEHTFSAASGAQTINFKGAGSTTVTVSAEGVTVTGKDYSSEIADAKSAGTAASAALEAYKTSNDAAVKAAKDQADKGVNDAAAALAEAQKKVASVKSGSNGIAINGTATEPTVALKIDTTSSKGNVTFTEGENGLSANVTIPEVTVPVKSVKSGDKVLKLEGTELSTTIGFNDDKTNKKIQLVGIDNAVLGEFSYADFIIDGMLQDVQYDQDTHKISFTFNTDAGEVEIDDIDLSDLVDRYEAGLGIKFTEASAGKVNKIEVELDQAAETKKYLSLGASGLKLEGVDAAIQAAKTEIGNWTVNGNKLSESPIVLDGTDITLTGYSKGSSSDAVATSDTVNSAIGKLENQIAAAKASADSAVQNVTVTNGTYVTATVTGTTTKNIAINDSAIESLFAWEEIN